MSGREKAKVAHRQVASSEVRWARDDGRRFVVVRDGYRVYPDAVPWREAVRLRDGLLEPAEIVEVGR